MEGLSYIQIHLGWIDCNRRRKASSKFDPFFATIWLILSRRQLYFASQCLKFHLLYVFQRITSSWDDWLTSCWGPYTQFWSLHSELLIFALNLILSVRRDMFFELILPANLLFSQGWVCSTVIRGIISSEAFGVLVTGGHLVLLIWVDEIYGYLLYFNLIISTFSSLYLLYIPQYVHARSETLLCECYSLSLSTRVFTCHPIPYSALKYYSTQHIFLSLHITYILN